MANSNRFRWLLIGTLVAIGGCASIPKSPTDSPTSPWAPIDVTAVLQAGIHRAQDFETQQLPALHRQFEVAQAQLASSQATAEQRLHAIRDLQEADYQANLMTLNTGLQLNAVRRLMATHDPLCKASTSADCKRYSQAKTTWNTQAELIWALLTGPVVAWRDAAHTAIAHHTAGPVGPVDYHRGAPQCRFWDVQHPAADTGL